MKKKKDEKPFPMWMIAIFFIIFFALIKTCAQYV